MAEQLKENFQLLKNLFEECLVAKNNPNEPKSSLHEKIKVGSLLFVLIKKVNRNVKHQLRTGRDELQYQKSQVDCNRLHLQNLLYEVNYLKREIRHCYQFKSQDEDIDIEEQTSTSQLSLMETDETDNSISKATNRDELSHEERIARLERELMLRKQLSADYTKLYSAKADLYRDIFVITEDLSTFAPSLRTLLKATRPLQEALQLPFEQNWKLEQKIHLLPQCLYLAYINLRTLEINDTQFKIAVQGSEFEVDDYEITRKTNINSHQQQQHQSSQSQNQLKIFQNSYEKIQFLQPHPLQLQIKIFDAEFPDDFLCLNFYYMPLLDVVTGHSDMCFADHNISANDISFLQNSLRYIYDNDVGDDFPKPEIGVKLEKAEITKTEFYEFLSAYNFGRPYRWLQHLCGNRTWNDLKAYNLQDERLKEFSNDIIKRIKTYWNCRLRLLAQVRAFFNKNWENLVTEKPNGAEVNDDENDEFSIVNRPKSSLVQWTSMTWEEYKSTPFSSLHRKKQLIDETFSFCKAIVTLNAQKMECYIGFSNKHPLCAPFWTLNIHWNGQQNSMNNSNVKMMEQWTNNVIDCNSVNTKNILAKQLWRTMRSFDEFLDSKTPNDRVHINSNIKKYFQNNTQSKVEEVIPLDDKNSSVIINSNSFFTPNNDDMES